MSTHTPSSRIAAVLAGAITAILVLAVPPAAKADPLPGFDLDPVQLERRMDDCLAGAVDDKFLLMGWRNMRTGDTRQWYCHSLKHMYLRPGGGMVHDPFVDVGSFMTCVDRTISYGFPRPGDPGKTRYIYQYRGTERRAEVAVVDDTGDIATIYTSPDDDWTACAQWAP